MRTTPFPALLAFFCQSVNAFPSYGSLADLSNEQLNNICSTLETRAPGTLPEPQDDTSTKLVNDAAHPWRAPTPADIRGPCPGLNTLASHGYIPRNGIASPAQIIGAVQQALNLDYGMAVFVTYATHLVDGNLLTDQLSIGQKTSLTGPAPPLPATAGGASTHGTIEGDSSLTRNDFFFGDNHSLNETLFDQVVDFSNRYGGGKYNLTVAGELRWKRFQDSVATNPDFTFTSPRYVIAFADAVFAINFFVDGRQDDGQLDVGVMRGFFHNGRMPDGFFRANGAKSTNGVEVVVGAHPVAPGRNVGGVNNYVVDPTSATFANFCLLYSNFVNQNVKVLYPNPTGALLIALNTNLDFLFQGVTKMGNNCQQVFPYGKP